MDNVPREREILQQIVVVFETEPGEERPGRPAIAVTERVDVPDEEVKDNRFNDRVDELVIFIREGDEVIDHCRDRCTIRGEVIDLRRVSRANDDIIAGAEVCPVVLALQRPLCDPVGDLTDEFAGQRLVRTP